MSVDELREYGLTETDDAEIRRFLSNQRVGVLGLPGDGPVAVVPTTVEADSIDGRP